MIDSIIGALSGLSAGWRVFFLSMLPITELRIALPLGIAWGMPPAEAFLWAIAGNFVPITPLLLLLGWLFDLLSRVGFMRRPLEKLYHHGQRNEERVRRWGWFGLFLVVAVPLPGTGVWTGCLVATILKLNFWSSLTAVTLGEVLAGLIVALISHSVVSAGGMGSLIALIAVVLIATLIMALRKPDK